MSLSKHGAGAALLAAALFGAATPFSKLLLAHVGPSMLAALLYLGSGLGLWAFRRCTHAEAVVLPRAEAGWLAAAILCGGVIAPLLLMAGLQRVPASSAAMLLNAESVLTALIAWFVFRENFDRRILLGMLFIVAGALVLSLSGDSGWHSQPDASVLPILGACVAWAIDNNLSRKVSLSDASWVAMVKGLSAGMVNLVLALSLGASLPPLQTAALAGVLGFISYGASLTLFVLALRELGTARTSAYFSVAPFIGALLSVAILSEPVGMQLLVAGALMAVGVWLHLSERHSHEHTHDAIEHRHEHVHGDDPHHEHQHEVPVPPGTRHTHLHRHAPLTHTHAHFPDAHHHHAHPPPRD